MREQANCNSSLSRSRTVSRAGWLEFGLEEQTFYKNRVCVSGVIAAVCTFSAPVSCLF